MKPSKEVLAERKRIIALLRAHKADLGPALIRLINLINAGVDLAEEMKLPPEDRAGGFHWPDQK